MLHSKAYLYHFLNRKRKQDGRVEPSKEKKKRSEQLEQVIGAHNGEQLIPAQSAKSNVTSMSDSLPNCTETSDQKSKKSSKFEVKALHLDTPVSM